MHLPVFVHVESACVQCCVLDKPIYRQFLAKIYQFWLLSASMQVASRKPERIEARYISLDYSPSESGGGGGGAVCPHLRAAGAAAAALFAQRSRAASPILYNYVCVPRKSARICPAKRELFGAPGLNRFV